MQERSGHWPAGSPHCRTGTGVREVPAVEQPQQIPDDEEYERVYERAAAIDVAKGAGVACTQVRLPGMTGADSPRAPGDDT